MSEVPLVIREAGQDWSGTVHGSEDDPSSERHDVADLHRRVRRLLPSTGPYAICRVRSFTVSFSRQVFVAAVAFSGSRAR